MEKLMNLGIALLAMGIFMANANLTIFGFFLMMGAGIIKACFTDGK